MVVSVVSGIHWGVLERIPQLKLQRYCIYELGFSKQDLSFLPIKVDLNFLCLFWLSLFFWLIPLQPMKHSVPMYTRGHAQTPAFQIWGRRGEREDALGTVLLLDQFTFGKDESWLKQTYVSHLTVVHDSLCRCDVHYGIRNLREEEKVLFLKLNCKSLWKKYAGNCNSSGLTLLLFWFSIYEVRASICVSLQQA